MIIYITLSVSQSLREFDCSVIDMSKLYIKSAILTNFTLMIIYITLSVSQS